MSSLVEMLYPAPDVRRTPLSLLRWWESRRLLYNQVVGAAGLFTLSVVTLVSQLPPIADPLDPVALVVFPLVYAVMANACYSLGWLVEMVARWAWGTRAPLMGPLLFREGLIFSVGLTLLPAGLAVLAGMASVVAALLS